MPNQFTRRSFLTQTTLSLLAGRTLARTRFDRPIRNEDTTLQNQLLILVNEERAAAGLTALKLDQLACSVAQRHASEMAENGFLSHWSRDGLKPYQRYSFAGGTEAIEENDGAADQSEPIPTEEVAPTIIGLHTAMHDESPPNDGHRKTILSPQHTHVGFGMACSGKRVRLSEIYLARYLAVDRYPAMIKEGKFTFSGRLLDRAYVLKSIDVYFERLPEEAELPALLAPKPYALPDERESLWPKLPADKVYDDGSKGSIQISGKGKFLVPIKVVKRPPGVYTIVVWISKKPDGIPFPVTQACVRVA